MKVKCKHQKRVVFSIHKIYHQTPIARHYNLQRRKSAICSLEVLLYLIKIDRNITLELNIFPQIRFITQKATKKGERKVKTLPTP